MYVKGCTFVELKRSTLFDVGGLLSVGDKMVLYVVLVM